MAKLDYRFDLPPEENVLQRNRAITTYYAKLYQDQPSLFKWAGMAAFASFHIGEKLQLFRWQENEVKEFSIQLILESKSLDDDIQIIRFINNQIFEAIGWVHLAFSKMDFDSFKEVLLKRDKHHLIVNAFEKLNEARERLKQNQNDHSIEALIWEANTDILWHEQSRVVQPLFDKLSDLFSGAMSIFASFDYEVNNKETNWKTKSSFITFMLIRGLGVMRKNWFIPDVTNLNHRWYWIKKALLKKWQKIESKKRMVDSEIQKLVDMGG